MCTATWIREEDRYALWFTRDERRDRALGEAPVARQPHDVEFLAPRDPESGGTWIGVNEFGLTVGLGNDNPKYPEPDSPLSRGPLVWDLLQAGSLRATLAQLARTPLDRIRPFILILIEPGAAAHLARWDGRQLLHHTREESGVLLATSSLGEDTVRVRRNQILAAAGGTFTHEFLDQLHGDPTAAGARAVCVERPEVASVSLTQVRVGPSRAEMVYTPGPPGRTNPDVPLHMVLSALTDSSPLPASAAGSHVFNERSE